MSMETVLPEPFGYFRAEPFGWTDCADTDEGAVALYDAATIAQLERSARELRLAAIAAEDALRHLGGTLHADRLRAALSELESKNIFTNSMP